MIVAARVKDGLVTDLFLVDSVNALPGLVEAYEGVAVGWSYDGAVFAPPPIDPSVYAREVSQAVQALLDAKAVEYGYDNILSAVSYKGSTHPKFGAEAVVFSEWRDAVWDYCYAQLALGMAGQRSVPTVEGFISELPAFPGV